MQSFLIAGYPRAGLCWLSRLFLIPLSMLINGFSRIPSIDLFWAAGEGLCKDEGVEFFGNAATANLMFLPSLLARRPLTELSGSSASWKDAIRSAEEGRLLP